MNSMRPPPPGPGTPDFDSLPEEPPGNAARGPFIFLDHGLGMAVRVPIEWRFLQCDTDNYEVLIVVFDTQKQIITPQPLRIRKGHRTDGLPAGTDKLRRHLLRVPRLLKLCSQPYQPTYRFQVEIKHHFIPAAET
ncbi:hypothetical protein GCM10010524_13630 [Streptomyces mexicanus]|jgi:hypothetical protein